VGLFASHQFATGHHAEASLRAGRLRNEFDASRAAVDYRDRLREARYTETPTYFGGHLGLGYEFEYRPNLMADVYGQAFWNRVGASSARTAVTGGLIRFGANDYVNLRAGVRLTYVGLEKLKFYAGAAYDRSLHGSHPDGTVYGQSMAAAGNPPTAEGGTGIYELGLNWRPFADGGMTVDVAGKGYTGKIKGFGGNLALKWEFGGPFRAVPAAGSQDGLKSAGPGSVMPGAVKGRGGRPAWPWSRGEAAGYPASAGDADLDTVTVEAPRPDWERTLSPGTVTVIEPDDYAGEQKTVADFLDKVPGLFVRRVNGNGQYTTLSVRGSTGPQVAVYIDGVPLKKGGDAAVDVSMIPALNIARIEVYRGYIPARFEGAPLGGVVNVVTKRPQDVRSNLSVGMSAYGGYTGQLTLTGPLGPGTLLLAGMNDRADGDFPYPILHNDYTRMGNYGSWGYYSPHLRRRLSNGHNNTDLMAKWQDDNWHVKINYKDSIFFLPSPVEPDQGYVDSPPRQGPTSGGNIKRQRTIQRVFNLGRTQKIGNLEWGVNVTHDTQSRHFRVLGGPYLFNPPGLRFGAEWQSFKTSRWLFAVNASYKLGERNLLEFHADHSRETLRVDYSAGIYAPKGFIKKYMQKLWHFQLQDTVTLSKNNDFWLTVVVRLDRMDSDTTQGKKLDGSMDWFPTWGVALKKDFGDLLTLRASYGTYNRFPNFYEVFGDGAYLYPSVLEGNVNNEHVEREYGWQWDAGADLRTEAFGIKTNLTVNYFRRLTHNTIMLIKRRDLGRYVNNQSVEFHGWELEARVSRGPLSLDVAGTVQDFKDAGKNKDRQFPFFVELPKKMLNARLSLTLFDGKAMFFVEDNYTGKVDYMSDLVQRNKMYFSSLNIVNAGVRLSPTDSFNVNFGVNDIKNQGPRQHITNKELNGQPGIRDGFNVPYPQQGRTWYTTVEVKF
jgi:outer membrane receptor protein involved in Fe transport